jgi:hypothetical protein
VEFQHTKFSSCNHRLEVKSHRSVRSEVCGKAALNMLGKRRSVPGKEMQKCTCVSGIPAARETGRARASAFDMGK